MADMQLRAFVGFPFSRAVTVAEFCTRWVLLAMNPRTLFHHLDIVSVSHHTETSCWFTGLGFLSSTLVKLLNLLHPYLVKQKKKKKKSADKGWHFRPRPCGNNDKPGGRWIKASNQQDRFQTSELFLIYVMSSVWMWMTAKAELSFDIPKKNLTVLHYFWEADFVWSFDIITCDRPNSWHLPPSLYTFSPVPLLAFSYCAPVYITYRYNDHNWGLKGSFQCHWMLHHAAVNCVLRKWAQEVAPLYCVAFG